MHRKAYLMVLELRGQYECGGAIVARSRKQKVRETECLVDVIDAYAPASSNGVRRGPTIWFRP